MIATDRTARLCHPWLRIQRLIRVILETRWEADEWPIVRAELRNALAERTRIKRAGWFIHEDARARTRASPPLGGGGVRATQRGAGQGARGETRVDRRA